MKFKLEVWWWGVVCRALACGGVLSSALMVGCGGEKSPGVADAAPDSDPGPYTPSCGHPGLRATPLPILYELGVGAAEDRLVFDSAGAFILTARSNEGVDQECAAVTKRAPNGSLLWRRGYNGNQQADGPYAYCPERWRAITLDKDDNIVAIGAVEFIGDGPQGPLNIMVRKLDADGRLEWTRYNHSGDQPPSDRPHDVAVDPSGGVIAGGTSDDLAWVASFAADGSPRWIWRGADAARPIVSVEADPSGNAIVATTGFNGSDDRLWKIDPAGAASLLAEIPPGIAGDSIRGADRALAVDVDGAATMVVDRDQPRVWKIASDGRRLWEADLAGLAVDGRGCSVVIHPYSVVLAAAPDRSIYVAFTGVIDIEYQGDPDDLPEYNPDIFGLARFSSDGEPLAVYFVEDSAQIHDLAIGPDGTVALLLGFTRIVLLPPPTGS